MWIIEDWTGKHVCVGETFDTFEEARGRISELANAEAGDSDTPEAEAIYNGVCEDLFAVRINRGA